MRVIFTCGGTGGHINPALAVANLVRQHQPDAEILFIGADDGMERELVPREGYRLECVRISNFQRSLTPKAVLHNLNTARNLAASERRARQLITAFQPDVILGTGGYASFPALKMGARMGIPTAVHESNAVPGLTTRMVMNGVDRILVPFEECRGQYSHPERVVVTGTPVREAFIFETKEQARQALGLDERPLVVSYWGSLGAREMNKKVADMMALECMHPEFQHIHATGSYGWRWMPDYVRERGVDLAAQKQIDMREYIFDMPRVMAAADVVICRAGASTISEVAASGTPAILIPSPNVTDNHQEKNARVLEQRGAAVVIREADCTGKVLYDEVRALLAAPERCAAMTAQLREMAVLDAAERIYRTILELSRER